MARSSTGMAASSRLSSRRASITVVAPSWANRWAVARPIPLDAPVTTTTLPSSWPIPYLPRLMLVAGTGQQTGIGVDPAARTRDYRVHGLAYRRRDPVSLGQGDYGAGRLHALRHHRHPRQDVLDGPPPAQ